tara:strand:+ start:593 stop:1237 length:645 start_codon:yes stop_codon:yes gene_type:complete
MNKNLNHKGASKRKGAAESEELTEDGPVIDVADKGMAKKKGAAQVDFGNVFGSDDGPEDDAIAAQHGGKKGSINPQGKEMAGFNFSPPTDGTKGVSASGNKLQKGKTLKAYKPDRASFIYDADQDGDSVFQDYNQDGTMVGRGMKNLADFGRSLVGARRTGFTQDFGAARQNGYAKGAAKVNSIMNFGAAKAKGAAEYGGKKGDDSKSKKDYEG